MKKDLIDKALSAVHSRKRKAELEFETTMQPLYSDPTFQELNKKMIRLTIENAKNEAYGENDKNSNCQVEQGRKSTAVETSLSKENLISQLETLKKKYNLQNEEPHYSCKKCQDNGYQNGEMCACLKREISNILLKESGFEKLENFENAQKTCGDLAPTYALMHKWCNSDFKKNLIYLAGPTGVGKTYLIRCMANELIERGKVVKIVTAYAINQDFKEFAKTQNDELLKKYTDCEILFIDDLGTEPLYRNVTLEYFYLIINERKMRKLPTIITSNLDMDDLKNRYEERITSRIADRETSITLYLDGKDKRLKK